VGSSDQEDRDKVAIRAGVCLIFGAIIAASVAWTRRYDPCGYILAGWIAGAVLYVGWTWAVIVRMDWDRTRKHATREDPTHFATLIFVVIASVASLVAVTCLLRAPKNSGFNPVEVGTIGVASVAAAWVAVHTAFALHYARLYYCGTTDRPQPGSHTDPGGVDFNQDKKPSYTDFAYVSFTIGMAYAVSDTALKSHSFRMVALWHALVSYVLGAVILAATINLVSGLGR
jgi:uncharacterized membrane protein